MSRYCVTFPLKTEKYQEDILSKRFEIGRKIYNAVLSMVYKRYHCLIETKAYRQLRQQIKDTDEKLRKPLYKELNEMYKRSRLNEYSLHEDVKKMQHHFRENIDSFTAQKIATRVWAAMEDLLFGSGDKVHFKRYEELDSLEGKSNKTGIRFKDNQLIWNGLALGVKIDYDNPYENRAMQDEICYCRIKRKFIKSKFKYYLQIEFKGFPPMKVNKAGEPRRDIGSGTVGLDIGTQSIAISASEEVKLLELADRVQNIENQKRRLLRYMDRSKRANNPDNFKPDGTNKKGKLTWKKSNRYKKAQTELKETYRKQADIREYQHQQMSNYILSLGAAIYVEEMSFKGLQRRSKKTEVSEKTGKIKKNKRFGKSLANKAPAKLLTFIDNKLRYLGKELIKVNTKEVKASQYNHLNGEYSKKKLSQRWNDLDGMKVQRDLYSAFLIQHIADDHKSIEQEMCKEDFEKFMVLHDKEIERLRNTTLKPALKNVI
ncbi:MAG: transposase [Clostridia bacterium BRH_c25]|nr:MAG: transposase [Clostridia bacterium BRH_c25]